MFNLVLKFVVILKEIATERHLTSTEEKMLDNEKDYWKGALIPFKNIWMSKLVWPI